MAGGPGHDRDLIAAAEPGTGVAAAAGMNPITVYGADWCPDTQAALNHLDSLGVQYQFVDIDEDKAGEAWVREHTGERKMPTIDVGGQVLVTPDEKSLEEAVRDGGMMA